jgi:hypothetical protein
MSAVSAGTALVSMFDTLSNPDASGWEKFTSVLMSSGMVIMSVSSMLGSFKKVKEAFTAAETK